MAKTILITGGNRGLGKNAALALAKKGASVVITYRSNRDEANEVVRQLQATGVGAAALQLDTGKVGTFADFAGTLTKTLQQLGDGKLDGLVNNAGAGLHRPFAETDEASFDELVNVHLKGVFFLTQRLLPVLRDGARIVNVSSGLARFSTPGYSAYAMMKAGIEAFTRYAAKELGGRLITVNTLAPGAIATDFGGGAVRDNPQVNAMVASQTALGRVGHADDIGPVVATLLLDQTGWINGQRIEASGGMYL